MTAYMGVNGVVRTLRAIDIGKGTYPDHIDTCLVGVNGVWRKAMTIHDIIDHVELIVTSKDSGMSYSVSSNGFTANGYNVSEMGSVTARFAIILKDGHDIFQWLSVSQYLLKHYTFTLNAQLYVYCGSHSGTINSFDICGNGEGLNFSGSSSSKTETYAIKKWGLCLEAERCNVSVSINNFHIDGINYPIKVVDKIV